MATAPDLLRSGVRAEDLNQQDATRLEALLRSLNLTSRSLSNALAKQVTLTDNVSCDIKTVVLSHGAAQLVSTTLPQAKGCVALSIGSADGKTRHALAIPLQITGTSTPGQVKLTAYFIDPAAMRVPITVMLVPEGGYSAIAPTMVPTLAAPTQVNGWADFGGGFMPAGYMKDALGFVHLTGFVTNAGGTGAGNAIFVLPSGYRPSAMIRFDVDSETVGVPARVDIDSSGNVKCPAASGAGAIRSLNNIAPFAANGS